MGKKVLRLTESDLVRIVEKVVSEQSPMGSLGKEIDKYKNSFEDSINDFVDWFKDNAEYMATPLLPPGSPDIIKVLDSPEVKRAIKKALETLSNSEGPLVKY